MKEWTEGFSRALIGPGREQAANPVGAIITMIHRATLPCKPTLGTLVHATWGRSYLEERPLVGRRPYITDRHHSCSSLQYPTSLRCCFCSCVCVLTLLFCTCVLCSLLSPHPPARALIHKTSAPTASTKGPLACCGGESRSLPIPAILGRRTSDFSPRRLAPRLVCDVASQSKLYEYMRN
jgi:hypothetical protein